MTPSFFILIFPFALDTNIKVHEKNDFVKISKNLARYIQVNLKIILLNHQNNYVGNANMMSNVANNFDILAIVKCST